MKKFKLLQDLPDLKAGSIFEYFEEFQPNNPFYKVKTIENPGYIEWSASKYTLIALQDWKDWFEEVKEPEFTESQIKDFAICYHRKGLLMGIDKCFELWIAQNL